MIISICVYLQPFVGVSINWLTQQAEMNLTLCVSFFTDCLWYSGLFEEKLRELSCLHSSAFHLIFDALANPVSLIWMMFEDILVLV